MQCNRERANNWVFMKQLKERRYYSGQKKDGKKYGDEDRISAGHSKKIRKGYEGSKKSRRDENKRASPGRQGRKSEERLKGDKVDVERQSRESFSREKLDENRSSEGQNRKSYGREGHGRNRTSGEIVSGESYSREGYGRNRTSGEELSRDSYNREKSRDEKRHEKVNRGSQDNEVPKRREPRTGRRRTGRKIYYDTAEGSSGSLDSSSIESERIEVVITSEFRDYVEKITIGKLSRHDFATTLRLGKLGFYCAMVSYVATMENFSMFTFAVTRHGMHFIIPFVVSMFCVGFPMTYLELALGQYTHATVLAVFDRIAPITVGIGVSAVLLLAVSILLGNDLIVIMVDAFFKSANAFTNQLPWDNCVGMNSRAHCQSVDRDCHNVKPSGVLPGMFQQRFYKPLGDSCVVSSVNVFTAHLSAELRSVNLSDTMPLVHHSLARFSDFYTLTVAKWPSSIFMAWIVIIFLGIAQLLATNRQAIIKSMSYICVSTIFLLTFMIVLVFVHFNPPKYPELAFLDAVNFKQEEELAMWIDAVVMACTILQLGYGGVIFLGMQNPFFNDLVTDAMVISSLTSFIFISHAIVHTLVKCSFILQMAQGDFEMFSRAYTSVNNYTVKANRASSKIYSIFLGSLEIFDKFHAPLTTLMALFGALSALASKFIRIEMLCSVVMEYCGFVPSNDTRSTLFFIICLMVSFFTLFFSCPDCYLFQVSLTTNVLPMATLVVLLCELFVIVVLYGTKRLFCNVTTMIVGKATVQVQMGFIEYLINLLTTALWTGVIPIVLCATLMLSIRHPATDFDDRDKVAMFILLSPIPLCALYKVFSCYYYRMNFKRLFIPDGELWGPRSTTHRTTAERNERRLRV